MKRFRVCLKHGIVLLTMLFLATSLTLTGCGGGSGSDSYDKPATQTSNVVIDAATLKGWVDGGLVNSKDGWENVVIIDVSSASAYAAGHIPGAQLWDGNSGIDRYEGPVLSSNMVLDGPAMDAVLQKYGIDEGTTVVFAGATNPGRIYFMFRYWGFPKERLKILDGGKAVYEALDPTKTDLTTLVPAVTPSNYSVKNLTINTNVRAALNELIIGVEQGTIAPYNTLVNNTEKAAGTTGIFADVAGDFVIFQGSVIGAKHLPYAQLYNADGTFKTAEEMKALLAPLDGSKPIIAYCRAGNAASWGFAPIDAVLGWNVMVYDGSWSQWGSLTNQTGPVPDASYVLPAALSAWHTDRLISWHTTVTDGYKDPAKQIPGPYYNINFPKTIEKPTFRIVEGMLTPYDAGANSIEIEDRAYSKTPPAGGGSTSTSGGGGGGC